MSGSLEFYTPAELSKILKIPASSLYELARNKKIPGAVKIGRHWRFLKSEVMASLGRSTTKAALFQTPDSSLSKPETPVIKGKILLIEDDQTILKSITRLLEKQGYQVTACTDGLQAIEKFKKEECWDLILSDVRMPGQDGIETIRQIRQLEKGSRPSPTPVIVMTGYADESAPIHALKLGVRDYFLKPFDTHEFLNSVQQCAQNCN